MTYLIQGDTGDWEVVIGLEVHAQVVSGAKLFSSAATAFGAEITQDRAQLPKENTGLLG